MRAGQVTKISRKGVVWKTNEAQMNTGGALKGEGSNVIPEVWAFSLDSSRRNGEDTQKLISDLERAARTGERVEFRYKEYMIPAPWNGSTGYYAQEVRFLDGKEEKPEKEEKTE